MQPQATQTPPKPETTEPQPKAAAATPSKPTKTGYGKRYSIRKWVVIYLVIAVVIYGIIYFAIHKSGGSSGY